MVSACGDSLMCFSNHAARPAHAPAHAPATLTPDHQANQNADCGLLIADCRLQIAKQGVFAAIAIAAFYVAGVVLKG